METLYLLVPMSLMLVVLIAAALWWALHAGQYDDLDRPGEAILLDNDRPQAGALTSSGTNGSTGLPGT